MYFQTDNYDALYRQNDKPIRSIEKTMNEIKFLKFGKMK